MDFRRNPTPPGADRVRSRWSGGETSEELAYLALFDQAPNFQAAELVQPGELESVNVAGMGLTAFESGLISMVSAGLGERRDRRDAF